MDNQMRTDVWSTAQKMISAIEHMKITGTDKALLSAFRHSVGKPLAEADGIWEFLFQYMPEEYLSKNGYETNGELSLCTMLQLYALCRQGNNSYSVNADNMNFGASVGKLRTGENDDGLDRRFNQMLLSDDFDELAYRLRQLVKITKSRGTVDINFPKLASDLYWWLNGKRDNVRLAWAQDYYRLTKQKDKEALLKNSRRNEK